MGYEKDLPRSIGAYRDRVIKAFTEDMPFDRFTLEQIAGDAVGYGDVIWALLNTREFLFVQ